MGIDEIELPEGWTPVALEDAIEFVLGGEWEKVRRTDLRIG